MQTYSLLHDNQLGQRNTTAKAYCLCSAAPVDIIKATVALQVHAVTNDNLVAPPTRHKK